MKLVYRSQTCRLAVLKWDPNKLQLKEIVFFPSYHAEYEIEKASDKWWNQCLDAAQATYMWRIKTTNITCGNGKYVFALDMKMSSKPDDTSELFRIYHKAFLRWICPRHVTCSNWTESWICDLNTASVMNLGSKHVWHLEMEIVY